MLKLTLRLLGLALAVSGCSQTAMFVQDDAATAQAIAASNPYTASDAGCFAMWGAVAAALQTPGGKVGIMATLETKRAALLLLGSPPCLPISAMLANDILKLQAGPIGGLLP
jgi:hypothetical protein